MRQTQHHSRSPRRRSWLTKAALRTSSVICCVLVVAFSTTISSGRYTDETRYFLGPACLGLAWSIVEGTVILARPHHHSLHPVACILLDCAIWLGFLGATIAYILVQENSYTFGEEYGSLAKACVAISFIAITLHFGLFAIACHETRIRNRDTVRVARPGRRPTTPDSYQDQTQASQRAAFVPLQELDATSTEQRKYELPGDDLKPEADPTPVTGLAMSPPAYQAVSSDSTYGVNGKDRGMEESRENIFTSALWRFAGQRMDHSSRG